MAIEPSLYILGIKAKPERLEGRRAVGDSE
jgi:hypothetical protein